MKFNLKKLIAVLAVLLTSTVLFAQSYRDYLNQGKTAERNGNYVYALAAYYDAMTVEPTDKALEAYNNYTNIADAIRSGKPGPGTYDEFDVYEGWVKLAKNYEKYWTENCPIVIEFGSFVKDGLDYVAKTADYVTNVNFDYSAKYQAIASIVEAGFNAAYNSHWTEFSSDWPIDSIYYEETTNFLKDGIALVNYAGSTSPASLVMFGYSEDLTFFDVKFNVVDTTNNRVIYQSERALVGDNIGIRINGVNRNDMAKFDGGNVKIVPTGLYLLYGDANNRDDYDREWISGMKEISFDVKKINYTYGDEAVDTSDPIAKIRRFAADKLLASLVIEHKIGRYSFETIKVEGGSFVMGSRNGDDDEYPLHKVTLSSFEMLRTEVTQELYKLIMDGRNPSYYSGDKNPVENTSWYDAIVFCNRLSMREGLTPCYSVNGQTDPSRWDYSWHEEDYISGEVVCNFDANGYRLPTEAEWEYAARGGTFAEPNTGSTVYAGTGSISEFAWYDGNSNDSTHPVATLAPNAIGLYDMNGNVWEWVWDYYGDNYTSSDVTNPHGPSYGDDRVLRGLGYSSSSSRYSVSYRGLNDAWSQNDYNGFRIVRTIK